MSTSGRVAAVTQRVSYTGGTAPPDTATGMAFTCWVRLRVDRNDFSAIFRMWSAVLGTRVNFATGAGGETPGLFSSGNTGGVISPLPLVVDVWRAIGCSISGTTGVIRAAPDTLTPVSSASGTVSGGATAAGFTLGGRDTSDTAEWFNGAIAYPRLFPTVMSEAEMLAEWASLTPVRSDAWAGWALPSLVDQTGQGRNLTAGSVPLGSEDGPPIDVDTAAAARFLAFF